MFKVLSLFVWTVCAVAFGVFLAKFEVDGRTPLQHAELAWETKSLRPSSSASKKTHGNYSEEERAAIDKIISGGKR